MDEPVASAPLKEVDEAWLAMIQCGYEESLKTYNALPWVFGERLRRERLAREGLLLLQANEMSGSTNHLPE